MDTVLTYDSGTILARRGRGERTLVRDTAFSLEAGESLAIIGETGSGKTMTALSIMGLLPDNVRQVGGCVRLCGRKVTPRALGRELAYIPQNGLEYLDPSRRVRHHLYDSLRQAGVPARQRPAAAAGQLELVGLSRQLLDRYPFQLSGGQAQRVTVALAACARPRLLIADEPTNGLDEDAKQRLLRHLSQLFPDAARLLITHDISAAAMADRVLVLCGGLVMETGAARDVLTSPRHPYTQALLRSLVQNGMWETPVLREGASPCPFYRRCPQAADVCRERRCRL